MQFTNINDFIAMGNHGFYVWLSFGITFALLIGLIYSSKQKDKQVKQNILKRQLREQKLKQAAKMQQQSVSTRKSEEVIS
ncbi:heme exporter protein CcmD [Thalassotalea piscium]|uniref:Heme exporter protein D n=1 Tax=Thalassotalea piscium TaxID=1230533 RepID=A0A7X0NE23_9GAMM|nr:heme exporter protein CcmD [Thalassotalea piscium]MBB6541735.1 heme exporter protein D [Thalassotalea piscium]